MPLYAIVLVDLTGGSQLSGRSRESSLRLVGRVYMPRVIGLGFAFVAVATFLYRDDAPLALWALLVLWGIIWPHVAHFWASVASDPFRCEIRNLYIDAFMIGFWVPVMSFNLVPSIAIVFMHLLSIISVLGLRAALLGLLTESAGIAVAVLLVGFDPDLVSRLPHLVVSLPMLVLYPLFVGYNAYSLSLKLAGKQASLRKLSRIDGLTGLKNRMYWEEQVERTFALARRNGATASMVFLDVDHFKQINDNYGHGAGDDVLRKIALLLLECARETDLCGRYGGEEFCILLPDTNLENALELAERVRLRIAETVLHEEHDLKASVSLGVAEIRSSMNRYDQWLDLADKALYVAKKQGRNRTVSADSIDAD